MNVIILFIYRKKQVSADFAEVQFHECWHVGKGYREPAALPAQCSTLFTACEAGHSPPNAGAKQFRGMMNPWKAGGLARVYRIPAAENYSN